MIEMIELGIPKILAFRVDGKLNDVSFKRATHEIMKGLDEETCNLYLEVISVEGVTFEAVWDSIKLGLRHLGAYMKKVNKIAVVTDISWMQKATKVENKLIPSIEEKVFAMDEKEMAKLWVSN